jgi:hypothetical protein
MNELNDLPLFVLDGIGDNFGEDLLSLCTNMRMIYGYGLAALLKLMDGTWVKGRLTGAVATMGGLVARLANELVHLTAGLLQRRSIGP